jgi:diacylglycerol kinase family enzyme
VSNVNGRGGGERAIVAVVYNPVRDNPVRVDVPRVRAAVESAARVRGDVELLWYETTPDEAGQAQTVEALKRGATLVLAAGGDGTVRAPGARRGRRRHGAGGR